MGDAGMLGLVYEPDYGGGGRRRDLRVGAGAATGAAALAMGLRLGLGIVVWWARGPGAMRLT